MINALRYYMACAAATLALTAPSLHAQGVLVPEPAERIGAQAGVSSLVAPGDDQWSHMVPTPEDGIVFEAVTAPNGDLYIGGTFTRVGGKVVNRIARWDGTEWHALGGGIPAGAVYAIAIDGNNVYVGGNFRGAGEVKATNIARWDGAQWHSFGDITREGLDSTVLAMVVKGTDIYMAGNFIYSNNQDMMNYITRWSIPDTMFYALDDGTRIGMDGGIATLFMRPGENDLYVGGGFTKAGGVNASRVAKWNGSAWSSLGPGIGTQGGVTPFVYTINAADTMIFVGGHFTFAGGRPTRYIARFNLPSSSWGGLGGGSTNGLDSAAYRIAISDSGFVYVTGQFKNAGGSPASHIAQWKGQQRGWSNMGSGLNAPGFALAPSGNKVWVGGMFTEAGDTTARGLAQWSEQSLLDVEENGDGVERLSVTSVRDRDGVKEIGFINPRAGSVELEIVDMRGEVIAMPVSGFLSAGPHTAVWNAAEAPAGFYLCRIKSGLQARSVKIVITR